MTETSATYDAIVVGAGPAGSMAGYHLASAGRRVLILDRADFPRDKSCGDGLIGVSVDLLAEMGLSDQLHRGKPLNGVHLHMADATRPPEGGRISDTAGLVIRRKTLDAAMLARARQAGARSQVGLTVTALDRDGTGPCRIIASGSDGETEFRAPYVIGADGGRSVIARQAGLFRPGADATGVARRAYYRSASRIPAAFHIFMPLPLAGREREFAGYGWVFPVDETTLNVGVGLFPAGHARRFPPLPPLLDSFVARLEQDPAFGPLTMLAPPIGGLLPSGGLAEACHDDNVLLVGDAAGLVDPFTGEGIHAALSSGKLAARAVQNALAGRGARALAEYGQAIAERFEDRMRMGERFLRSYHYASRVIEQSARQDAPVFRALRRATFGLAEPVGLPDGLATKDMRPTAGPDIADGLDAVATELSVALNRVNPLLRRITPAMIDADTVRTRVGLFLALHLSAGGHCRRLDLQAATAVELCALAFEFHAAVADDPPGPKDKTGEHDTEATNSFVLLAGDGLLTEAYAILTRLDDRIRTLVSEVAAGYCVAWLEHVRLSGTGQCDPARWLALCDQTAGALFGLSAQIGVMVAGQDGDTAARAGRAARPLGVAASLLADIRLLADAADTATSPSALPEGRPLPYPLVWAGTHDRDLAALIRSERPDMAALSRRLRATGAIGATRETAMGLVDKARSLWTHTGAGPISDPVRRIADDLETRLKAAAETGERRAS